MKFAIFSLALLLPVTAGAIGAARDTEWPAGAVLEVGLALNATTAADGTVKITGDLTISNRGDRVLQIQEPTNRLVLAFLLFDSLGNPVAPQMLGKVDPAFRVVDLAPQAEYVHHFDGLNFVTGSAWLGYKIAPGAAYRVIAVYRPAGPNGPGFASREVSLKTEP